MSLALEAAAFPIGAAALAVALFAVALRRADSVRVRVAGALLVALAWVVALDWPRRVIRSLPGELSVATNAPTDAPWRTALAERAARDGVSLHIADGALDMTALLGALQSAPGAHTALVHGAALDPRTSIPLAAVVDSAHHSEPPWPFDADDFDVVVEPAARVQRPFALTVHPRLRARLALGARAHIECTLTDALGAELARVSRDGSEEFVRLEYVPESAAPIEVRIEVRPDDGTRRLLWRGEIPVGPAPTVTVVGPQGGSVVRALRTQGVEARHLERLPDPIDERSVIVATGAVAADDADRLRAFVDGGGGLLLVGGVDGGAVPLETEPLADLSPLLRLPETPRDRGGSGAERVEPPQSTGVEPDRTPRSVPSESVAGDATGGAAEHHAEDDVVAERRPVALLLVVDCSGSMTDPIDGVGGRAKIDLARASALATSQLLEPGDEFGVLGFDTDVRNVLPLGPLPDRTAVETAIARLGAAGGGTLIGPVMRRAAALMGASRAPVRHVVLITDGELEDPVDAALGQSFALRLGEEGVQVSAILVVPDREFTRADRLYKITSLGRGRFVQEADGDSIPRFCADITTSALRAAGRRPSARPSGSDPEPAPADPEPTPPPTTPQPTDPVPAPTVEPTWLEVVAVEESPLLEPRPESGFPALAGIVHSLACERAAVLLATRDGAPLFAWRHFGLGRVAAWASDLDGPWAERWRADPTFPARLATFVSALVPASELPGGILAPSSSTLTPPGPRAEELDWLARAARDGKVLGMAELPLPPPRRVESVESRGADLALVLIAGLIALAMFEAVARRRPA